MFILEDNKSAQPEPPKPHPYPHERVVRIIKSKHSDVNPGALGYGTMKEDGWEVLFEKLKHTMPNASSTRDTILWFKFDEVEVVQ